MDMTGYTLVYTGCAWSQAEGLYLSAAPILTLGFSLCCLECNIYSWFCNFEWTSDLRLSDDGCYFLLLKYLQLT